MAEAHLKNAKSKIRPSPLEYNIYLSPDMTGDVELPGKGDGSPVLASHHIEPLELDAEHEGRPLDLILLGGRHLLVTLLALVHVLPLAQVLAAEVARQRGVNVIRLSDEHNRCNVV